ASIETRSRVRWFTLIGGLTGVVTGFAMTIWMANDWPIMLGGKPFSSIPPYTIIGFELTILFGGLLPALGRARARPRRGRGRDRRAPARPRRPRGDPCRLERKRAKRARSEPQAS